MSILASDRVSLLEGLGMFRVFAIPALLVCTSLVAQDSGTMILVANQSGAVQLIHPSTLETVGRIHLDFALQSVGLNGVFAGVDGTLL
jgi:hypothetical protein